jgi:tRNA pseudouridine55 synthase
MPHFGLLNLNKSAGWTSRDVVNRVQRLVRPAKAGHAGTLDPLATGVLVVALGQATRLIEYVQRQQKQYRGTFLLGYESDTEDTEGNVRPLENAAIPTRAELEAVLPHFIGRIEQRPPTYSALKIAGRRAYDLARRGEPVELAPRPIDVFDLQIAHYAHPELVLDITCGSGTYVRSLGRDIANSLGTAAVMSALIRTAIGPFRIEDAVELDSLTAENLPAHILPARLAISGISELILTAAETAAIQQGKRIARPIDDSFPAELAALDPSGQLIAIVSQRGATLHPTRVFNHKS